MMRTAEFIVLFFAVPSLLALARNRVPVLPVLWLVAVGCFVFLWNDPTFARARLWDPEALPHSLPQILTVFAVAAIAVTLAIRRWAPDLLFSLPRTRPVLWIVIMILYPVLSVYPQGVIFRAFLLHRYAAVFGHGIGILLAGALAFGYMHIVFRNGWAIGLATLAGILFVWRYQETGSLFVSSFEHALYGCLMFTAGMGGFFYHGTVRR